MPMATFGWLSRMLLMWLSLAGFSIGVAPSRGAEVSHEQARSAMHRAVAFFREQAASEGGGYVYRVTADLSQREGESKVGTSTAWLEPPGTPAVGMAYLTAYRLTGDSVLRDAAVETAVSNCPTDGWRGFTNSGRTGHCTSRRITS